MGSADIYRAAAGLVRQNLPELHIRAPRGVWTGAGALPEPVVEYFREFGVLEGPLPAGGVAHRLWRPEQLDAVQVDWHTRLDGARDPRWSPRWLGLISESCVVWAFDRETEEMVWIDSHAPSVLPCSLAELIAILVASAVAHRQLADSAEQLAFTELGERADSLTLALAAQVLGRFGVVREVLPLIG